MVGTQQFWRWMIAAPGHASSYLTGYHSSKRMFPRGVDGLETGTAPGITPGWLREAWLLIGAGGTAPASRHGAVRAAGFGGHRQPPRGWPAWRRGGSTTI